MVPPLHRAGENLPVLDEVFGAGVDGEGGADPDEDVADQRKGQRGRQEAKAGNGEEQED